MNDLFDAPFLWYLNRTTGFMVLGLITVSMLLGVLAAIGRPQRGVPIFANQLLHRNLSLLAVLMLVVHVSSAVIDTYVDIRWWQTFIPFGATYQPLWLGLGAVALDLIAIIVVTSLFRSRLQHRPWRIAHLLSYFAFALAVTHGIGIGTDTKDLAGWGVMVSVSCLALVVAAGIWRLARLVTDGSRGSATQGTVL